MNKFEAIAPTLADALADRGYETLTPVQEAMLNPDLSGRDLLVSAQTGSGKTVAFGLAAASDMLGEDGKFGRADLPFMLVIAPTRELALQVKRELDWLYAKTGARVASCVGGMDMRDERRALGQGAHIVVGTPGRLVDHVSRGSLNMDQLRIITLDEADEMLDMGFRDELQTILDAAPEQRRTLLFSATVSRSIANLAKTYQQDAVRVNTVAEQSQHIDIEYRAITVAHGDKENAMINVLRHANAKNAIVFCATRAAVNRISSRMNNRGFAVVALSGEFSQKERSHALQAMRDGRAKVCVATDVAARGIDLPDLELVIHADLPKTRESLLHRSGRTGRAGRKGVSALIVGPSDRRRTERLLQNAKIDAEWIKPPSADDVRAKDNERLLEDPVFEEPGEKADQAIANALLERYGPEKIANALVRLKRAEHSAPEELRDFEDRPQRRERSDRRDRPDRSERSDRGERAPRERSKSRDDFSNGVWFSLSVGRKQTAEARWLLPMLCKSGGLSKQDIGAIRVHENVTFVELSPASVDGFNKEVGPDRRLEKSISVTQLDGMPDVLNEEPSGPPPRRGKPPHVKDGPRKGGRDFGDRPKRPDRDKRNPRRTSPRDDAAPDTPARSADPKSKYAKKPHLGKKPGGAKKPAGGKAGPRKTSTSKPGGPPPHAAKGKPKGKPLNARPGGTSRLKSKLKRKAMQKRGG